MTLLEYISSLQDQGLSNEEIFTKGQEWKKNNPQEEPVEEQKTKDVEVKQDDSQTQDPSSESEDNIGSESESGSSQQSSFFSLSPAQGLTNKKGGFGSNAFAYNLFNKMRQDEASAPITNKEDALKAKPGQTYIDHGYEYKYEVEDGKGVYYTKVAGKENWIKASGLSAASIASQFGHSDFNKDAYFEQKYAREAAERKQLERLKELQKQIDSQQSLTENKEVETDYVNTADRYKQLLDIKRSKTRKIVYDDVATGRGRKEVFDENVELEESDFGSKEEYNNYRKWQDLTNKLSSNTGYKGAYSKGRGSYGSARDNELFEKLKAEGRNPVRANNLIYADPENSISEEEWNKANQERIDLEASMDEGDFEIAEEGNVSKFFTGENRVVKSTEQVPTTEAVNNFNSKYINTDSENTSGINFSDETSVEELEIQLNNSIQDAVNNDPLIQKIQLEAELRAKPLIAEKQKELSKKYNLDDPAQSDKANKELEAYYSEIMTKDIGGNPEYKNRVNEISVVGNQAFSAANVKWQREGSYFLKTLDYASNMFNGVPGMDWLAETNSDLAEGIAKGGIAIGTGFDKFQASYDTERAKSARDRIIGLQEAERSGKLNKNSIVSYYGKKMPLSEAYKKLKLEEKDWIKALENNLDEIKEGEFSLQKYKQADLEDGDITWSDIVLTTGEALPQIGLATIGTIAAGASGGTLAPLILGGLGTVTMGVTMYGDAYFGAAQTGAQEDYEALNGVGSWNKADDETRRDFLVEGLQTGRYHDPGKAAVTAAVQTAMEKIGAGKVLAKTQKALGVGKGGFASLIAGDFKQFGKNLVSSGLAKGEAALTEMVTEGSQEIIGAIGQGMMVKGSRSQGVNRYLDMGAAWTSAKAGGIVGFMLPFGASVASQSTIEIRNAARKVAINFAPSSGFGTSSEINAQFFKNAQNTLDTKLKTGKNPDGTPYTKEQHQEDSISIANIKNASDKIPAGTDKQTREKMLDLMIKRDNLNRKIESVKDEDLTQEEKTELAEVKTELRDIMKQEALFKTSGNVKIAIEKASKGNIEFQDFNNAASMNQYAKEQKIDGWQEKNSANHGVVLFDPKTGKERILINNELSLKDSNVNVAAHEFLHSVLRNTVQNSKGTAIALGKNLQTYLEGIDISQVDADSAYGKRLAAYKNDPESIKGEEAITIFSDAIANGDIKFNESIFTKIGDAFRRTLQAAGLKNIRFDTGRDVYNFVKDYNKSIEKGKGLNKAQQALLDGRAEGELVKREYKPKAKPLTKVQESKAEDSVNDSVGPRKADGSYDVTNAEWKAGKADQVITEVLPKLQGLIESKIPTVKPPGFSKDDFVQNTMVELIPHIRNFKPEQNNSLSGWINSQLSNKIGNTFKTGRAGTKADFETDITEAAGVTADTETDAGIDTAPKVRRKPKSPTKTKQYSSVLTENMGGKDVATEIDTAIAQDLKSAPVGSDFGKTRNIGESLGNTLGQAFGINPKVFTDKRQNIQKKDLKGLVNLKQHLNSNAQQDFKNLPNAYNDKGKSTFIPNNILNALYVKDGKGKWKLDPSKTLNDYKALLGDITSQKPIYRAAEAQTIKGLASLSFRNLIFEKAVPSVLKRKTTGVKFSKQIPVDSDKGKSELNDISNAKDKKAVNKIIGIENLTITPKNRVAVQLDFQNQIENNPDFDLDVFDAGMLKNSGAQRTRLENGDVVYSLSNGKTIPGNPKGISKVSGKKLFSPPTAKEVQDFAGTNVTLVADRNRLYYGKSDPAYITARQSAQANTDPNKPKAKRVPAKKANTKAGRDQAKINQDILESVATRLETMVANGMPIQFASIIIEGSYQATTGLTKIAAPINSASIKPEFAEKGKSNQVGGKEAFREEHSPPASVIGGSLIWAIKNGQVANIFPSIRDNYTQTLLSKKDDVKIDRAGLDSTLPDGVDITTPNAGIRRLAAAGINLNTINDFKSGKTFADIMGVGVDLKASKRNPNIVYAQNALISEQINNDLDVKTTKARIKAYEPIAALEVKASKSNNNTFGDKVNTEMTIADQLTTLNTYDKAARKARSLDTPKKGISVFDFDDTLAKTKEKVIVNKRDGSTVEISASEFAVQANDLQADGATFDFSNFEGVSDGTLKGPLADLALRRQDKFGSKDIFVLTARPQASAQAIKTFLDGIGLNLPIENITGLEDGSPSAKGNWMAEKASQGYNDFYFADDSLKNVEAVQEVLSQVDVNSEVQLAKFSKRSTFDKIFNDILESSTGIESFKEYSRAKAQTVGKKKGRFSFFTTPSAEDFLGLLYKTLGKGKVGDAQMDFYKKNLLDPYDRAELAVTKAKIQAANDFKALKRNLKTLPKSLNKEVGYGGFTFSQAARVAAWARQGMTIPGLSKTDLKALNDIVDKNAEMNTFVDELIKMQKDKPYPAPGKDWLGGSITTDILSDINKVNRKLYLQEWQENVDIIFSEKNMNKLEAAYGPKYVEALRDQLRRMKSGSNRPVGGSRVVNQVLDWLNNSVGAIMFLNTRSAVLQTLSAVNFIGVGNNGLINSAKAFANQKQYWKDFKTLMNSPYLVERRNGLKINVSESEIADAVAESSDKPKAALSYLLNKGFILTRFADSFAIATGGAAFYRNQLSMYLDQGMNQELAQQKAYEDFYAIAEKNQQSSNPSKISQQQASGAGRVILAFANTPMQYARIIKRSTQDLINGRGNWKKNIGTIAFYGVVQNLVFNALQNALFAEAFGEDEEDEKKEDKAGRIANGMADSLLAGLGIQGKATLSLKNSLITLAKELDSESPKFVKAVYDLFDFSPPLDSKFRKLRVAANTFTWDRKLIKEKGFSLDNPAYLAGAQVVSGLTNIPLDRAIQKMNNIRGIMSERSQNWQKLALSLGWSTWDVGLGYYGGFDPVKPLTPEQQYELDVTNMKKETTSKQQKQTLLDLGLTRQELKKLRYEEDRVKKIIELQKKKKNEKSRFSF